MSGTYITERDMSDFLTDVETVLGSSQAEQVTNIADEHGFPVPPREKTVTFEYTVTVTVEIDLPGGSDSLTPDELEDLANEQGVWKPTDFYDLSDDVDFGLNDTHITD